MFLPTPAAGPNLYSSFAAGAGATALPSMRRLDYSHDVPPLGCNPDAMKLFVGNIPKSYTADSLRPLFEAIGTVVELVVVRDKLTDESKGSAFVWYQTRAEAERAIAELHLRRVLQDPTGEQDRPLVVRRANPKVAPVLLPATMFPPQPTHAMPDADLPAHLQGASLLQPRHSMDVQNTASQMQMLQEQLGLGLSPPPLSAPGGAPMQDAESLLRGIAGKNSSYNLLDPLFGQPTAPPPGMPSLSSGHPVTSARTNDLSSILQNTLSNAMQQSGGNGCAGNNGGLGFGQMTLALHVSRTHVALVATNLHSIQGNTGASVQLTPGSGDGYVLLLSGNDANLDAAKTLVHELVAQSSPSV